MLNLSGFGNICRLFIGVMDYYALSLARANRSPIVVQAWSSTNICNQAEDLVDDQTQYAFDMS